MTHFILKLKLFSGPSQLVWMHVDSIYSSIPFISHSPVFSTSNIKPPPPPLVFVLLLDLAFSKLSLKVHYSNTSNEMQAEGGQFKAARALQLLVKVSAI